MKIFINNLSARDRSLLFVGGSVVAFAIMYFAVFDPFYSSVTRYRAEVPLKKEQLVLMQNAAKEVNLLKGENSSLVENGIQLTILHNTADQYKLRENIKRLEPENKNKVRVWVESVDYANLINWIYLLENRGISVTNLSVDRIETPGLVNAKLTLQSN